ncbi:MAG: bifunctional UDP-N-acetylglucosamine diphosphorylase/glucosamine-1-phosphate N-acetyltransferase GlmU [Actinomycetia bacterium]|nr:bifunctional UDP-N-acetylglucosamine diphosphorylase/glucosamine-1-phosphate N-acetyltransferase GlmU [Actinomycetes bacterium]
MRSAATPKALHGFAGRSLLAHMLAAAEPLGAQRTLVVIGHGREAVREHLAAIAPDAIPIVQAHQRGTGHAVRVALAALPAAATGTVLVLPGDMPLLTTATLRGLLAAHDGNAATALTAIVDDPTGYGRVIRSADGAPARIVEHRDATAAERAVAEIATSVYAFELADLRHALSQLRADNAQGEEYLPDAVAALVAIGRPVGAFVAPAEQAAGVNDRAQLAAAHRRYNARLLDEHMRAGVTVVDPATTWVDADVTIAADAVLLPSVDLHGATAIAAGAVIGPQTSLHDTVVGERATVERAVCRDAVIGADATIGPFTYLRPGTRLAERAHIGAYVEVKGSDIGAGTKVPHLSYVGDATVGAGSNIGAATIFVNYDGITKHRSVVGDNVRIGSDSMIVAPRVIGDGAYTAAGAVVMKDVPPGALARSSARQETIDGWVARKRPNTPAAAAADRAAARTANDNADQDPADRDNEAAT